MSLSLSSLIMDSKMEDVNDRLGRAVDSPSAELGLSSWIEVDLSAFASNIGRFRQLVGPSVKIYVVVKANAYGHGLVRMGEAAISAGADGLAVARVEEGIALRDAKLKCPVLVMNHCALAEAVKAVGNDLSITVDSKPLVARLSEAAENTGRPAKVHVKVDTGLGRFGLTVEAASELMQEARMSPWIVLEGLYSHFACADGPEDAYSRKQFERFERFVSGAAADGRSLRHICNTAAAIRWPEMHLDAVRVGLGAYGHYPAPFLGESIDLRPALSVKGRIVRVFDLAPGESVGYGRQFFAPKPMRVGLVPLGYADGVPWILSGRGEVLIRGVRAPILGRVSMDQLVIDAGMGEEGDEIVFIGAQGGERITVEDVARIAGTISYEILTSLGARLPRVYIRGGLVVAVDGLSHSP